MYNKLNSMHIKSFANNPKIIIILFFALFFTSFAFASEPASVKDQLVEEAKVYRDKGLQAQDSGNLDQAMSFYQKAVELDSSFAPAFNDIGIIYEERGIIDRAEASYLKAITIDPDYLSAYTNLALLYESKRDLARAAFYWEQRAKLGSLGDPWTINAKKRAQDINLILSKTPMEDIRQLQIMREKEEGAAARQNNQTAAYRHFMKAKECYYRQDYAAAIKEAVDAQLLDPTNERINKFIEKVQVRALSK